MRFSIVIPTWEQHGKGTFFLTQLLNSIKSQTFSNYEVIISDHSKNNDLEKIIKTFHSLNIQYIKNEKKRGNSPHNLNVALSYSKGELIKTMFQDDFFINKKSLEKIHEAFKKQNCKWLVNGCCHTTDSKTFYQHMIPKWNEKILEGVNTISSPSVLTFVNQDIDYFDEDLTMMMDCDYYFRLYKRYGLPFILEDYLIANTAHAHQISRMYDKNIQEEIKILKSKNYES